MSRTAPAAGTSLPSNRRGFIASLAAASALGLASAPVPAARSDAALMELEEALSASRARRDVLDVQMEEAMDRYVAPDIPAGLLRRDSDYSGISFDASKCAEYLIDGEWRHVYEEPDNLTLWAQRWWREGDAYANPQFTAAHRLRAQEIKTANEAWKQQIKDAEDAAGVTTALEAVDRECETIDRLTREIAGTTATTLDGLAAKARIIGGDGQFPAGDARRACVASMIADAVKLVAAPSSGWRAA